MNRRQAMIAAGAGASALLATGARAAGPADLSAESEEYIVGPDGTRLFVRDWGAGRPVLFLAGWTLPSDFWCYQMLALAQNRLRAIAFDRRGHGRSSDPGQGYDHDMLADDLRAVINGLRLREVIIVAHSMGCTEVARYFSRHGGREIAKVVLVGTITPFLMQTPDNPGGIDRQLLAEMRAPIGRDFPAWIDANTAPFFTAGTSPGMMEWGKRLMLETSLLAAAELARANAETDFREDLRQIDVQALIIHGDRDISAPLALTAEPTARIISGAELRIYEGAPHGLPLTHIERLNEDLLSFAGSPRRQ